MGVNIHKVPLTWKHPRDENGQYVELAMKNGRRPPTPKRGEAFGFMFYSSVSDMPYSDQIFTDRREMMLWWLYASPALDAQSQNYRFKHSPDAFHQSIGFWFDREDVPRMKVEPFTPDEMPRCLVLDGEDCQIYAKARQTYRDGQGVSNEALDAMFEMFDRWLREDTNADTSS